MISSSPGVSLPPQPAIAGWEWRWVILFQVLFLLSALPGLNAPFTSMHYVRQNHTFDIARHVYREGWPAVIAPRFSISQLSDRYDPLSPVPNPTPQVTFVYLEVPFLGIFGWPAAQFFPDKERAISRLVAIVFSIASIALYFLIARRWVDAPAALAGAAIWASAPLILHFGQVPMPDVLALVGLAACFLFALRGNLACSSAAFLFTVLAKMSILIYGLPILTALLLALGCRSLFNAAKWAILWGTAPLLGLATWLLLAAHAPPGSWDISGNSDSQHFGPIHLHDLLHWKYYLPPFLYLVPLGCGILGIAGLIFASWKQARRINPWILAAIFISIAVNYVGENIAWHEPQYTIPVLFWLLIVAAPGLSILLEKARQNRLWRISLIGLAVLHLLIAAISVAFLKTSRVANFSDIQAAKKLLPPEARVVVYSTTPNVYMSVWLDHNTLMLHPFHEQIPSPSLLEKLNQQLDNLHHVGFDYLLLVDAPRTQSLSILWQKPPYATDYTSPQSPLRQDFDTHFPKVLEGDHLVLYALPASK